MGLKLPPTQVDIGEIRRKYHAAAQEQTAQVRKQLKSLRKK